MEDINNMINMLKNEDRIHEDDNDNEKDQQMINQMIAEHASVTENTKTNNNNETGENVKEE